MIFFYKRQSYFIYINILYVYYKPLCTPVALFSLTDFFFRLAHPVYLPVYERDKIPNKDYL